MIISSNGFEFPFHIGIMNDMVITSVTVKEAGKSFFADYWLEACRYRYNTIMMNDVTQEEYLQLLSQGKGDVEITYFDDITGKPKTTTINPLNGFSMTLTSSNDMPLDMNPEAYQMRAHHYISLNKTGMPILVTQWSREWQKETKEYALKTKRSLEANYAYDVFLFIGKSIKYFSAIQTNKFFSGGFLEINSNKLNDYYSPLYNSEKFLTNMRELDLINGLDTPFIKITYRN
jgi:hypothetical protein